jgi:hypothetical protein
MGVDKSGSKAGVGSTGGEVMGVDKSGSKAGVGSTGAERGV